VARFADLDEFGPTLDAAAERLGISPTAVEKDYWVSEVLRVLGRAFGGDFIFKGGTSLPKAYRLVERFSEDIDRSAPPIVEPLRHTGSGDGVFAGVAHPLGAALHRLRTVFESARSPLAS